MIRPYYLRDDEDDCQCVRMGLSERHDELYECRKCRKCCADECSLKESFQSYDDQGICIPCFMEENPEISIEEIAGIVSQ